MSPRNLVFLLGLLVILTVMYLVVQRAERPEGMREALLTRLGHRDWKDADEIRAWLGNSTRKLVIRFSGGRWEVWGPSRRENFPHPAREALVERLLSDLSSLSGEERASGKDYEARFDLTPESALHIAGFRQGRELFHLLVGKRGPYWESCFVRLHGREEIYLIPENLLARFEIWSDKPAAPSIDPWVDKTVLSLDPGNLRKMAFFWRGSPLFLLKREKKGWTLEAGGKKRVLSGEEVTRRLRRIFPLLAEEVVSPQKFGTEEGILEVETETRPWRLLFSRGGREFYYVKKGSYVYRVRAEVVRKLKRLF
ncbi:DUF4340 domain-containing protein [Thermosulfurimonas sp. F29]|uniref:DUF4340 domain-containing protein n=1 Tax=Thermosulfurimonas sp. F29 TaxID=2867247 RepID=UPI001C83DA4C|nr:DUF4340 domain-containing protein [Thermosulfurimonas sp. F29]MBX6422396.1 DUF4340 domain-containing protein [Thermosulfurimonas sp. F29]